MGNLHCSENLQQFLSFIRGSVQEYNIAIDCEADANAKTQDLLHALELESWQDGDLVKISHAIANVRNARRKAKDDIDIRKPIVEWAEQNDRVIKGLEQLLGLVRKAESGTEGRFYREKTNIMSETMSSKQMDGAQAETAKATPASSHEMTTCPSCGMSTPRGHEVVPGYFQAYCKHCGQGFYVGG